MKKILIFGATGLIGRNLVKELSKENLVIATVRDLNKAYNVINNNVKCLELDLTNFQTNCLPSDIEEVYFIAQSNRYKEFPDGSEDMLLVNVVAAVKVINWAIKFGVRKFFYTSSGGIYGVGFSKLPYNEDSEIILSNKKLGFYLSSKLCAEILLKNYAQYFETFIIARPFFVYGPNQNKIMLIPRLVESIINRREIVLSSQNGIKINPIFVDDAVKSLAKMAELNGEFTINIAGKEIVSIRQISLLIGELIGIEPIFKINYDDQQKDLYADISLMTKLLHEPQVTLKEGLLEVIKCWK